jgi:DNA polymerase
MTRDLTAEEILGLIDWQRSMGADAAVADHTIDWLAREGASPGSEFAWPQLEGVEPRAAPELSPGPPTAPGSAPPRGESGAAAPFAQSFTPAPVLRAEPRPQTPLAPSSAETDARRISRQALTLATLEAALRGFDGCGLKATATNLCFYRGAPQARLMLIGEAPGREEDIEGKPFVGPAGKLLDKMLAAIGLDESHVHITNVVYWRPPGNRTPTPQEMLACRPFLERQMELVAPDMVVVLGGAAAKEVFGVSEGIMKLRGKWRQISISGRMVPAMATLHPAYLLRTPAAKQSAWADLLSLQAKLGAAG